jgi:hypothetical protein
LVLWMGPSTWHNISQRSFCLLFLIATMLIFRSHAESRIGLKNQEQEECKFPITIDFRLLLTTHSLYCVSRKLSEKAQYMKDNTVSKETVSNEAPLLPPSIAPQNRSAPFPVAYILLLTVHICNSPSKIRSIDSEQGVVENLAISDIDKEIEKWKRIKASAERKAKSRTLPEAGDDDPCVGCWFLSSTDVFIFDNRVGIPSSTHKGKSPIKKVSSVLDTVVEVVVPSSKPKAKPPVKKVDPVPNSDVEVAVPSSNHKGKKPAKIDTPSLDSDAES